MITQFAREHVISTVAVTVNTHELSEITQSYVVTHNFEPLPSASDIAPLKISVGSSPWL